MRKIYFILLNLLVCSILPAGAQTLKGKSRVATEGEVKSLVVRVQFTDKKFKLENSVWNNWFNLEGGYGNEYFPGGSVVDYYVSQSGGKYKPSFDVYDAKLPTSFESYAADGFTAGPMAKMAKAALNLLSTKTSFTPSKYDSDGDGVVDNVTFILALDAVEDNYSPSQASFDQAPDVAAPVIKGLTFNTFNMITEYDDGEILGIGTFIHEFGHVMGFPDCYYSNGSSYCSNRWDIMNEGIYNYAYPNDPYGSTPPNMNAYEVWALGWRTPVKITEEGLYEMNIWNRKVDGNQLFESYYIDNPENKNEVYVFEYRSNATYLSGGYEYPYSEYDGPLPGKGMLIWHILYEPGNFKNNSWGEHIKLMCADNDPYPAVGSAGYSNNLASDPWPGFGKVTTFSSTGAPAFKWGLNEGGKVVSLNGQEVMVTDIREENNKLSFRIASKESVVEEIGSDGEDSEEWFTLDGVKLGGRPIVPGIYIGKQGSGYRKIIIR